MLTDRMFEPGGEKDIQGLKVRKKRFSSHNTDSAEE
jgi:hypothetical protein